MRLPVFACAIALAWPLISAAQPAAGPATLTYIPNSSVKLYQVNGDCDWVEWDATITSKTPTCKPTTSRTVTNADVLGDDVPVTFEHNGELIVTFGDTIGAANNSTWTTVQNTFLWQAHDPIARSTTMNASDGLLLNFFLNGKHGLEVLPPPQPNGTAVNMGIDDVPHTGVSLNGTIYLGIKTGNVSMGTGDNDQSHDYSVLATFDEMSQTFTSGRTISSLPGGHFTGPTFYNAPAGLFATPVMLIFGTGDFRASNVYLSMIPAAQFASGVDGSGNSATRYFAGMNNGQPTWSATESDSVPVVTDVSAANPTIGNASVFYSQPLGLWIMMFDGGRNTPTTEGMYITYAPQPWGPWTNPQLVFNPCRDKAFGNYMYYYYGTAAQNSCSGVPNSSGPSGPTIGTNDPATTRGAVYGPALVERFTTISGSTLKLYYMISTWNPYAVVMMESDFNVSYGPVASAVVNAEGGSPTIAPNTWVSIYGSNLAPAGDSRTWQTPDFVNNRLPTQLDGVSATVNGKNAFVSYISPGQVNILTPPDAISGQVQVVLVNNGAQSAGFTAQGQAISPSFFVFNGGPYVAATHADGSPIGQISPAKPGEIIVIYANGFGATTVPVVSGSMMQSGTLSTVPVIQIGAANAMVQYAGLISPGLFQFNVVVPPGAADGDQTIAALYGGQQTQSGTMISVQH